VILDQTDQLVYNWLCINAPFWNLEYDLLININYLEWMCLMPIKWHCVKSH